jgi:hypothetical protein
MKFFNESKELVNKSKCGQLTTFRDLKEKTKSTNPRDRKKEVLETKKIEL